MSPTPERLNDLSRQQLVSVIIPAYNYAHYLPETIASVLAQTQPGVELIVVDDGSTDATPTVAARYGDQITYVRQANAGLSAARNTGLGRATAPFVVFLDADDVWRPEFLATCLKAFAELPDDYAAVACRHDYIGPDSQPLARKTRDRQRAGEITVADLLLRNWFNPGAVLVRRRVFAQCGVFDTGLTSSEDRDLWLRLARVARIHLLPDALVLVRDHPGSMSKNASRMRQNTGKVLRRAFQRGCVPWWRLDIRARSWSFFYCETAWTYDAAGRHLAALGFLALSLLLWPWFGHPARLNEPVLFRLRASRRFLLRCR